LADSASVWGDAEDSEDELALDDIESGDDGTVEGSPAPA
jgi:hypothetical protein